MLHLFKKKKIKFNIMIELHKNSEGVFGRVDFRKDGKLWRENKRKNFFKVCLIGWRGRKRNSGA